MKPNLSDYPEIPPGCCLNENKHFGLFQVYRNIRIKDPVTGKSKGSRETIGSIKDGKFTFSKTYLLSKLANDLSAKLNEVQCSGNPENSAPTSDNQIENKDNSQEIKEQHLKVSEIVDNALVKTSFDKRDPSKIEVPMLTIVLGSIMSALNGNTGCTEISDAINHKLKKHFAKYLPSLVVESCSHDTVRKAMLLVDAEHLGSLYTELLSELRKDGVRVIAADGQAVRATGHTTPEDNGKHGTYMLMNFYDTANRVCLYHRLIQRKENEITVGHEGLKRLNLNGAVVTADAMNCQEGFVETAINKGAHYCVAVKSNQEKTFQDIMASFNTADESQIIVHAPEPEKDHGRLDEYQISIMKGKVVSKVIREKWMGLEGGSIVKVVRESQKITTKAKTTDTRYYISSIPCSNDTVQRIGEVVRQHWGIENQLHWLLDVRFNQDRMQANNPNYIANRSALNKLALAYLQNYRFWLWNTGREKNLISLNLLQKRCGDPEIAMECIACSLGLV